MSELDIRVGDGDHTGYVRVMMNGEWRWMPPMTSAELAAVEAVEEAGRLYCNCQAENTACSYCGCCGHSYYTDWECEVEEFPEHRRCPGKRRGELGPYACYCEGADDFYVPSKSQYQRMREKGDLRPRLVSEDYIAD